MNDEQQAVNTTTVVAELTAAMTSGGLDNQEHVAIKKETQQERLSKMLRIVGIGTFNRPEHKLTLSGADYQYGVRVLGPVKAAVELDSEQMWMDSLKIKGWVYTPFKIREKDRRIQWHRDEGTIVCVELVACCCKACGATIVRTIEKRDLIEAKHGVGAVTCKVCDERAGQPLIPIADYIRDMGWLNTLYYAWADTKPELAINLIPRMWGLYPADYTPVKDLAWEPHPADNTACQLAKGAMFSLNKKKQPRNMVIRPLSLVRIEQSLAEKEGRKSQLIELRLETPMFRTGWLLPAHMRRTASGDELPVTLMPARRKHDGRKRGEKPEENDL